VLDRIGDAAVLVGLALAAGATTTAWALLAPALLTSALVPYVKASFEATFARPLPPPLLGFGLGRDARLLVVALAAVALQPLAGLAAVVLLATVELVNRLVPAWRSGRTAAD
jgi:hypothetical protein